MKVEIASFFQKHYKSGPNSSPLPSEIFENAKRGGVLIRSSSSQNLKKVERFTGETSEQMRILNWQGFPHGGGAVGGYWGLNF